MLWFTLGKGLIKDLTPGDPRHSIDSDELTTKVGHVDIPSFCSFASGQETLAAYSWHIIWAELCPVCCPTISNIHFPVWGTCEDSTSILILNSCEVWNVLDKKSVCILVNLSNKYKFLHSCRIYSILPVVHKYFRKST